MREWSTIPSKKTMTTATRNLSNNNEQQKKKNLMTFHLLRFLLLFVCLFVYLTSIISIFHQQWIKEINIKKPFEQELN